MTDVRNFELHRDVDVSNVSGTGVIAEGVVFSDGRGALHWLGEMPMTTEFANVDWVVKVHGHGGLTRLVWTDEVNIPAQASPMSG